MSSKLSCGIDFGTTNSTVAVVGKSGQVTQVPIDNQAQDPAVMRSVIFSDQDNNYQYGSAAVKAYVASIADSKRAVIKTVNTGKMIKVSSDASSKTGFKPDKIVPEIITIEERSGGRLFQGLKSILASKSMCSVNVFGQEIAVEELVGYYIKELKSRIDLVLGESITHAVVGRPVKYVGGKDNLGMERMSNALRLAGFEDFSFEYEPVGAALDYGESKNDAKCALVFDFGGGTLDISVVEFPKANVLSTVGLPIGGDYFNSKIFTEFIAPYFGSLSTYGEKQLELPRYIFNFLQSWFQISLLKTERFFNSLESFSYKSSNSQSIKNLSSLVENNLGFSVYEEIERVKKNISLEEKDSFLFDNHDIYIEEIITRVQFEKLIANDMVAIQESISKALARANIDPSEIDSVVTTGGSSLIPVVRKMLKNIFGAEKLSTSNTFTSVASGLAIRAKQIFSP